MESVHKLHTFTSSLGAGRGIQQKVNLHKFYFYFLSFLNLSVDTLRLLQECLSGNQQNMNSSTTCAQACSYLVVNTALFILSYVIILLYILLCVYLFCIYLHPLTELQNTEPKLLLISEIPLPCPQK